MTTRQSMLLRSAALALRTRAPVRPTSGGSTFAPPLILPSAPARSLQEAYALRDSADALLLPASEEVRCMNLMCEQVTRGCACRLELPLGRLATRALCVDLSLCALPRAPGALFAGLPTPAEEAATARYGGEPVRRMERLRELRLQDNLLQSLPVPVPVPAAGAEEEGECEGGEGVEQEGEGRGGGRGPAVAYAGPLPALEVLDLRRNAFSRILPMTVRPPSPSPSPPPVGLPLAALARLPSLRAVYLAGNPLLGDAGALAALRASSLGRRGVLVDLPAP